MFITSSVSVEHIADLHANLRCVVGFDRSWFSIIIGGFRPFWLFQLLHICFDNCSLQNTMQLWVWLSLQSSRPIKILTSTYKIKSMSSIINCWREPSHLHSTTPMCEPVKHTKHVCVAWQVGENLRYWFDNSRKILLHMLCNIFHCWLMKLKTTPFPWNTINWLHFHTVFVPVIFRFCCSGVEIIP